jgi:hypothetical protein
MSRDINTIYVKFITKILRRIAWKISLSSLLPLISIIYRKVIRRHSIYGAFQGYDVQNHFQYNVLAFKTNIPSVRLVEVNSQGPVQVGIKIYKNVECFDFNSSFDIFNVINKKNPIIIGEFVLFLEDPH